MFIAFDFMGMDNTALLRINVWYGLIDVLYEKSDVLFVDVLGLILIDHMQSKLILRTGIIKNIVGLNTHKIILHTLVKLIILGYKIQSFFCIYKNSCNSCPF